MPGTPTEPTSIPTGNSLEDVLENVVLGLNQMVRIAGAVAFPAVSLTPIAVYRVC